MNCTLLWIALAAPAPVQDKIITPPKGLPPSWATAVIKDGTLEITQGVTVPVLREEVRQRQVTVSGRPVTISEKVTVMEHRLEQRTMRIMKPRYYDTAGKEIDTPRAAKLLSRPAVVLVSADGKPLDPYYLRTVKEGTLIVVQPVKGGPFVPGLPSTPPPPPPPPPTPKRT